ncbi:MAG: hypothetical protein ACREQO_08615 [Candidatus Binatia bacterium]
MSPGGVRLPGQGLDGHHWQAERCRPHPELEVRWVCRLGCCAAVHTPVPHRLPQPRPDPAELVLELVLKARDPRLTIGESRLDIQIARRPDFVPDEALAAVEEREASAVGNNLAAN